MKRASPQALTIAVPNNAKQARSLLEGLRADGRAFSAKLRELELHPAYRRLRSTKSTGSTKQEWDRASLLADELAVRLQEYLELLDQAGAAVGERGRLTKQELARMTSILNGQSPAAPQEAPAQGSASPPAAEPQGVLALSHAMAAAHEEVARTVDSIEEYASTIRRQLHDLETTLRGLRSRISSLAFPDDASIAVLDGLERELTEITPAANADPRGCLLQTSDDAGTDIPNRLRRLARGVETAHMHLSTLSREQAEWQAALADLRTLLADGAQLQQECRDAESKARARVLGLPDDGEHDALAGPRAALAELERRHAGQAWSKTRETIDEIKRDLDAARQTATGRREAAQALLEQRDILRGRLSAYRAMATRLNHTEDLDLAAAFDHAHRLLWSGPCDLAVAADAVAVYQRAVIERTNPDDTVHNRGSQQ